MTFSRNIPESKPIRALREARSTYRVLAEALIGRINRLHAPTGGEDIDPRAEAREFSELIGAHQRALQTVLDLENRMEKRIAERLGVGFGDIDLDRARDEVMGRLARLVAKGGG